MYKNLRQIQRLLRKKEISSVELLEDYLRRIDQYNPKINAVVILDVDRARLRARLADQASAKGICWGLLHGIPLTVKECIDVAGLASTYGALDRVNQSVVENAQAVQRLLDAGAIIMGKTNLPLNALDYQTQNKVYGVTNNPWDLTKTPGGSSGGSAAALASGMSPLELGSDICGSLRIPASFCGVCAHKPSYGIVSNMGNMGLLNTGMPVGLQVIGPYLEDKTTLACAKMIAKLRGEFYALGTL